jgi:hypothetical protein
MRVTQRHQRTPCAAAIASTSRLLWLLLRQQLGRLLPLLLVLLPLLPRRRCVLLQDVEGSVDATAVGVPPILRIFAAEHLQGHVS